MAWHEHIDSCVASWKVALALKKKKIRSVKLFVNHLLRICNADNSSAQDWMTTVNPHICLLQVLACDMVNLNQGMLNLPCNCICRPLHGFLWWKISKLQDGREIGDIPAFDMLSITVLLQMRGSRIGMDWRADDRLDCMFCPVIIHHNFEALMLVVLPECHNVLLDKINSVTGSDSWVTLQMIIHARWEPTMTYGALVLQCWEWKAKEWLGECKILVDSIE